MLRIVALLLLILVGSHAALAQSAPITQVILHEGECRRFDVEGKSEPRPGACKAETAEMIFADGFTSVQFTVLDQNGKETEKAAFIGRGWTQTDDYHASLVIDQFMAVKAPYSKLAPKKASGFCTKTLRSENGPPAEPAAILCEYNSATSTHIFRLRNIKNSVTRSVQQ